MGLLTVDVTNLGVVIASDSQPVEIYAQRWAVKQSSAPKTTNPILPIRLPGFAGFAGYVGTEIVRAQHTRDWLTKVFESRSSSSLSALCDDLAAELTHAWEDDALSTHLSIFVTGYAHGSPVFWFVSNGEPPDGFSPTVPAVFEAVNDLGGRFAEVNAKEDESQSDLIARTQPSFRRGCPGSNHHFRQLHATHRGRYGTGERSTD